MKPIVPVATALCACASGVSLANQTTTELATLYITGAEPKTSSSTNHYSTHELAKGFHYADAGELVKQLPGVTAGRMGGHGLEPVIRGQSMNQLSIVAGGASTLAACSNRMDPPTAYLDLAGYNNLTVVKGYQSVLHGAGGTGGSLIATGERPKDSAKGLSGQVTAQHESNGQLNQLGAKLALVSEAGYLKLHANTADAGNYHDGNGQEVRSAFESTHAGATVGVTTDPLTHLYASVNQARIKDALFAGAGMDSPLSENKVVRLGAEKHFLGSALKRAEATAFDSRVEHVMDNFSLRTPSSPMQMSVGVDTKTQGGSVKTDLEVAGLMLSSALEYAKASRVTDQVMRMGSGMSMQSQVYPDLESENYAAALETTLELGAASELTAGVRYDHVEVRYSGADTQGAGGRSANQTFNEFYGYGASNQTEDNLGGLLRLNTELSDSVSVHAGVSRALRTASFVERGLATYRVAMGTNSSWVGNPELKPEAHHELDLGMSKTTERFSGQASVFANRVSDFILKDSAKAQDPVQLSAPSATVYRNIEALLAGAELQASYQVSGALSAAADLTYTYGQDLDSNQALAQIPPLQGSVSVEFAPVPTASVESRLRFAFEQPRADTSPATGTGRDVRQTPGYAVLDVAARFKVAKPVELSVGVNNLFDTAYANHLNRSNAYEPTEVQVNEPGRSLYMQALFEF